MNTLQNFDFYSHYIGETMRRNAELESHLEVPFNLESPLGGFLESRGYSVRVEWQHDQHAGNPWVECDGHGEVEDFPAGDVPSGWTVIGDAGLHLVWAYDTVGAMTKAIKDGWGVDADKLAYWRKRTGNTKLSKAYAAVLADREYLRRYLAQDWYYVGATVTLVDASGKDCGSSSLWGIAYDPRDESYVHETLNDLVHDAAHDAQALPRQRAAVWRMALVEARERKACAARGIITA
jgi:hypothetical protein